MEWLSGMNSMDASNMPFEGFKKDMRGGTWNIPLGAGEYHALSDASLFSSSLPVLPHRKLVDVSCEEKLELPVDDLTIISRKALEIDSDDSNNEIESHVFSSLLPDDVDALFSGLPDDLDLSNLPNGLGDFDDDFFGSGGGLEIDSHDHLSMSVARMSLSDSLLGNGMPSYPIPNGVGAISGEHPYGEHPSRTLFVRNINSNIEDSELRALFEQYGEIRALHTASKHRGFVIIHYYDIRAARTAMKALQNKPLRRRKLDIHFSIPKDNSSEKDMNQGTLVAFNLDPSLSNDDLLQIFGEYGEVKEIRETPYKRHHKFIEFYDVRSAEAALKSLNRRDIAGKRVKLEPSRPGGTRRNMMLQLNQNFDQGESQSFSHHVGSPINYSPPGNWRQFNRPIDHSLMHTFCSSPKLGIRNPAASNSLPGKLSFMHQQALKSLKTAPIGKDQHKGGSITDQMFGGAAGATLNQSSLLQSHSFPESSLSHHLGTSAFGTSLSNGSAMGTLSGPQFLWGSPNARSEISNSPALPKFSLGDQYVPNEKGLGNGFSNVAACTSSYLSSSLPHQSLSHHVGSAPSRIPLERHFGFLKESRESSFVNPVYGSMGTRNTDRSYVMNSDSQGVLNSSKPYGGHLSASGSPSLRMMSFPRMNNDIPYSSLASNGMENFAERGRNRRGESNGNIMDTNKQFQLDLKKIISGEDTRTTLMIKNIPNKYTSKMLLAAIDEQNSGTYDFLYLPIDFKNKCNVGYAFINMLSPKYIIPLHQAFDGKKWEKFNSDKVASLTYARIQGKAALVTHFQNSSLMNEDKRCRPIVFNSDGVEQVTKIHNPTISSGMQVFQPNASSTLSDLNGSTSGFSYGFTAYNYL